MSPEPLDLEKHDLEELPGKSIQIGGAWYELLPLIAEGGEKSVFPIRNLKSGTVLFVAKLIRVKPSHPQWAHYQTEVPRLIFAVESSVYTEIHAFGGGLFELDRLHGHLELQSPHAEIARGIELGKAGQWQEAEACFAAALRDLPTHTMALYNRAAALINLGRPDEAVPLLARALRDEPNDTRIYHALAMALEHRGQPEHAAFVLHDTLQRYSWDYASAERRLRLGLDHDLMEVVVRENNRIVLQSGHLPPELQERIRQAMPRWKRYQEKQDEARTQSVRRGWEAALALWREAGALLRNDVWAGLNERICLLRLGRDEDALMGLLNVLRRLHPPARFVAAGVLLVCAQRVGEVLAAASAALLIDKEMLALQDLPGTPIVALPGFCSEDPDAAEIITSLEALRACALPDEQRAAVEALREKYRQLKVILDGKDSPVR